MKKYLAILLTMALVLSTAWSASAVSLTGENAIPNNDGTVIISGSVTDPVAGQKSQS